MIVIGQAGSDAAATIQTSAMSDSSIVLWFAPRKSVATATPFQQDCLSGGHRQHCGRKSGQHLDNFEINKSPSTNEYVLFCIPPMMPELATLVDNISTLYSNIFISNAVNNVGASCT
jgi:hypothetical protein